MKTKLVLWRGIFLILIEISLKDNCMSQLSLKKTKFGAVNKHGK